MSYFNAKAKHKELKKEVSQLEYSRAMDRSFMGWYELRKAKKKKLRAKDELHGVLKNES